MGEVKTGGEEGLIACEVCLKEIPKSVALSHEGPERVHHFCGAECYEKWQASGGIRQIKLTTAGFPLDFETAQVLAQTAATRYDETEMPIAWFDRDRGKEYPDVPECQHKPGWLAYAEGHSANVKVDINGGQYVFMFSRGL